MSDPEANLTLTDLGWSGWFARQLSGVELTGRVVGRVFAVQRNGITVMLEGGSAEVPVGGRWFQQGSSARPAIGDWVLIDRERGSLERVLERRSLLKRVSPGRERDVQLIAANVDTLFLVTACNDEFNPSRLERYLALALDAGVEPVVVLTKADLAADPQRFVGQVRGLKRELAVELVDATDPASLDGVRAWCRRGHTVALLGSSGVGKSTLVNTLSGRAIQLTREAREDDAKGRHTTTGRSLHVLQGGGLLVDNPGLRELSLADSGGGAGSLFDDVADLAAQCRFRDCRHEQEPACAVREAIARGELDPRRLASYRKLLAESASRRSY